MDVVRENPASAVKPPARAGLHTSPVRQMWVLAGVLVLATIAVYYPVGSHPFANYDDDAYVTKNSAIQSGLNAETVKWAFTTYYEANWHPVTWLSHALDCQLFELNPAGHHDINLLLHCCNVLLLFWVLWRATGYPGRSLMVAALFALHPINVESVAWVAERKNVLSMFFFLLALGAYGWYARKPRLGRYGVVTLSVCAGLDGQAAGDYVPLCFAALGLLAVAAHLGLRSGRLFWYSGRPAGPAREHAAVAVGESPLLSAFLSQRDFDHAGAVPGSCRDVFSQVHSSGERRARLWEIYWQGVLAVAACRAFTHIPVTPCHGGRPAYHCFSCWRLRLTSRKTGVANGISP